MPRMRPTIAIDCRPMAGQPTGVGRFLGMIVDALELLPVEVRAYIRLKPHAPIGTRAQVVTIESRGIFWHTSVVRDLARRPVSAYLSTSLLIPALSRVPALPLILDTTTYVVPELHRFRTLAFERALMPLVVRRRTVLTMSRTSAEDITRFARPTRPVLVVPPWVEERVTPPDASARIAGLGLVRPYVMFVGTVEPRKNLPVVTRAVESLRRAGLDIRLAVVGSMGWADPQLRQLVETASMSGVVVRTGYLSDADRDAAYSFATAVVMPSVYEGFGLPVIEAMSRGVPVLCSSAPALAEAAAGAAIILDPHDVRGRATMIRRLVEDADLRARYVTDGAARAKWFTKERTATALANAFYETGLVEFPLKPRTVASVDSRAG